MTHAFRHAPGPHLEAAVAVLRFMYTCAETAWIGPHECDRLDSNTAVRESHGTGCHYLDRETGFPVVSESTIDRTFDVESQTRRLAATEHGGRLSGSSRKRRSVRLPPRW